MLFGVGPSLRSEPKRRSGKRPKKGKPRDAPYVAELTSAKQSEDDHAADRSGDNHQS
jgi:hypothetical protein